MLGFYGTIFGGIVSDQSRASVAAVARREGRVAGTARGSDRRGDGLPVLTYEAVPGVPPVSVVRFPHRRPHRGGLQTGQAHTHDFLALTYFESGGGLLRLGEREWSVEAGETHTSSPRAR